MGKRTHSWYITHIIISMYTCTDKRKLTSGHRSPRRGCSLHYNIHVHMYTQTETDQWPSQPKERLQVVLLLRPWLPWGLPPVIKHHTSTQTLQLGTLTTGTALQVHVRPTPSASTAVSKSVNEKWKNEKNEIKIWQKVRRMAANVLKSDPNTSSIAGSKQHMFCPNK